MKKIVLLAAFIALVSFGASAQIEDPVTWSYGQKRISKTEAIVYLKATIDDGWHIYSQNIKSGGPIKTTVAFASSKDFVKVGATAEPKPMVKFEKTFDMDVTYFEKQVIFQQKVKLSKATALVKGKIEFMVCNDRKCLPPTEVDFSVLVK
jgi:DsbC/DsbD-like thiol-disulfide interchange protein